MKRSDKLVIDKIIATPTQMFARIYVKFDGGFLAHFDVPFFGDGVKVPAGALIISRDEFVRLGGVEPVPQGMLP